MVRNAIGEMGFEGCEVTVRINSLETDYWKDDLDAIIPLRPDMIMPAKVSRLSDIFTLDTYISGLEEKHGMEPNTVKLIPLIETALGVENAFSIATASPRVTALSLEARI